MKCPDCQYENTATSSFCGNCGKRLILSTLQKPEKNTLPFTIPEKTKKVQYTPFLLPLILGSVLLIIGIIMTLDYWEDMGTPNTIETTGLILTGVAVACLLASQVFAMIILYRAWQILQHGMAETTPGQAVGFLFIPLFNLYWIFVAYGKWAKNLNTAIHSRDASLTRINENTFMAFAILTVVNSVIGVIPVLNLFAGLVGLGTIILSCIVTKQMCDTVNQAVSLYGKSTSQE